MSHSQPSSLSPVTLEAEVTPVPDSVQHTRPQPWLLWTGVLGAILALLGLLASMLLGQRMVVVQQQFDDMQQSLVDLQAQRSQLEMLQQHLQQVTQMQAMLDQQQQQYQEQLSLLKREKANGWQLSDAAAVGLMLSELKALTLTTQDPQQWVVFLKDWQAWLLQAGMKSDHALIQALQDELSAIRIDWSSWQTEMSTWQQLSAQLSTAELPSAASPHPSTETTETQPWWQFWGSLVRISPATLDDQSMSQQIRERSLWPVQTSLALEGIRSGLILSRPEVVQASASVLANVMRKQTPALWSTWQPTVEAWQQWQTPPKPQWQHLQRYLDHQRASAS